MGIYLGCSTAPVPILQLKEKYGVLSEEHRTHSIGDIGFSVQEDLLLFALHKYEKQYLKHCCNAYGIAFGESAERMRLKETSIKAISRQVPASRAFRYFLEYSTNHTTVSRDHLFVLCFIGSFSVGPLKMGTGK
ncbi:MAG TPA: hypothetical protein VEY10_16940 [Flavisolibacter sp.]|nr:hypothetical protein [Flavisolibacter sp.]